MIKGKNINNPGNRPRILVAPLDWGLGHSTRCIPIINKLLNQNCEVLVAAEGAARRLLENEFQNIIFLNINGYRIHYSQKENQMAITMLAQLPKIIVRVYRENNWLKKMVPLYSIDAVISDNRLGLYHSVVPSVYITHQLKIKTGFTLTDWIAQKIHYRFINRFSRCWVPDFSGDANLAGALSHPSKLPQLPVHYIGPLSRFEKATVEIKYDLAIILSGPEPQRTIFEKLVLHDLSLFGGKALLIRGLPADTSTINPGIPGLEVKNHLPSAALNLALLQSGIIIGRCGYTTVMDLLKLQKKAILIPTPGQTEQEYLAEYLMSRQIFLCLKQKLFSLPGALKKAEAFSFSGLTFPLHNFEKVIEDFVQAI